MNKFTKRKQTVLKDFCETFRELSFNCGPKSGPKSFGARNCIFDNFTVSQRKQTLFLKFAKPITEKYRSDISVITFTIFKNPGLFWPLEQLLIYYSLYSNIKVEKNVKKSS